LTNFTGSLPPAVKAGISVLLRPSLGLLGRSPKSADGTLRPSRLRPQDNFYFRGIAMFEQFEQWVEIDVERRMDKLDRLFLSGQINQSTYNKEIRELDQWATEEIRRAMYSRDFS
jgi:hypothetical protein